MLGLLFEIDEWEINSSVNVIVVIICRLFVCACWYAMLHYANIGSNANPLCHSENIGSVGTSDHE